MTSVKVWRYNFDVSIKDKGSANGSIGWVQDRRYSVVTMCFCLSKGSNHKKYIKSMQCNPGYYRCLPTPQDLSSPSRSMDIPKGNADIPRVENETSTRA